MEKGNEIAVCVRNACKSYGSKEVLNQLNMTVQKGTIYGLLGASGCGKTTLLSCIVGRKKFNSGNVWVLGGEPGTPGSAVPGPLVGYMPQDLALVAEFTVQGAVYYFGRIFGMKEELIAERFQHLSKLLDLPPKDRFIKNCSGGQQRRVSFAAALVSMPKLLILDEPTVGLDPVLRESIWNYLVEIAEQQNVAVIITTHYIEETRQAHKIGLMRQGRLLAEDSPERLLSVFRTDSLEEVFLLLSRHQAEGRLQELESAVPVEDHNIAFGQSSSTVSMVMTDLNNSKDELTPKLPKKKKQRTSVGGFSLNGHRMKALLGKNIMQLVRNPSGIAFMMMFPVLEMLAFFLAIGNDVRGIKIAVINDEDLSGCTNYSRNGTAVPFGGNDCKFNRIGCRFLQVAEDPMMELIPYNDAHKAIEAITHGDVVGALYIPKTFTPSLQHRFTDGQDIKSKILNSSQIHTWLDMSNRQIGTTIKYKLIDKTVDFLKSVFEDCGYLSKLGDIPVKFEEDVYGHYDETFLVFMTPGVLLTIMFFMGATNTSSIIITDRLEGVWDRSIVAGVSSMEILLTHFVTQFSLVVIQTAIVLVLTFAVYNIEFLGNFGTMILLILLQAGCGMAFGFWVSVVSNSHSMANIVTSGSFYPMILTCGLMWPIEGMPIGLQWAAKCLPFTIPIISLRNVIKKGWSILHLEVINGIGIEVLWIIIFGVISGLELKRRR